MKGAGLIIVLATVALLGASAQAQGAAGRAGAGHAGRPSGARVGVGVRSGGRVVTRERHRERGEEIGFFDPFWYDYEEPYDVEYAPPPPALAPPMLIPPPPAPPEPQRIPSNPKMMELPGTEAAAAKPQPPAVFILNNGERIESRQYLITADRVQLTVDRQQRRIPLDQLDLKATTAANRERGIDLRIPASGGEVSLGF